MTGDRPDPDALLARFRATGAPADLGALFDRTAADLFRVAVATAPDAAAAEDAVQETFLAVVSAAPRWDPNRRAMPWLLGILKHKVEHERAKAGRSGPPPPDLAAADAEPARPVVDAEAAARAWSEIEALDEPYRSVALLRWRYGLLPAEIAHVRAEAPGTTRSLLSRALDRVRKSLRAVPAAFLQGGRSERGLDSVREGVLTAASRANAAPVLPWLTWRVAAGALALLFVGVGFVLFSGGGRDGAPEEPVSAASLRKRQDAAGNGPMVPTLAARPAEKAPAAIPPPPRATARGQVVTEDGQPVPGARITSAPRESDSFVVPPGFGGPAESDRIAATDADGRFEVPLADGEPTHELFASAEGRGPVVVGPVRAGSDTRIVLPAGAPWTGRVVDGRGRPIEGARVTALVLCSWFPLERGAVTDAEGKFSIHGLPSRVARLRLFSTAYEANAPGFETAVVKARASPGTIPQEVEIVLRRGSRWGGRVLDGDTARPLAGADVTLWSQGAATYFSTEYDQVGGLPPRLSPFHRRRIGSTKSDADGRWALDHVPCLAERPAPNDPRGPDAGPRIGTLEASAPGYASRSETPPRVVEDGESTFDFTLWRSGTVTGRVVRPDGSPAADATGFLETASPVRWGQRFTADSAGLYRVSGIPVSATEGAAVSVRPRWDAKKSVEVRARAGESATAPDLVLEPAAGESVRVSVRVVTEGGRPVERALVFWHRNGPAAALTDGSGLAAFDVPRAALARHPVVEFTARREGYAPASVRRKREELGSEEIRVLLPEGRAIGGRVSWSDGRPVVGAFVTAASTAPPPPPLEGDDPEWRAPPIQAISESDGSFLFTDLPDGDWTLSTSAPTTTSRTDAPVARVGPLRAGTSDVLLRFDVSSFDPGIRVTGRVVDDRTGVPVSAAFVRWRRADASLAAATDATGTFAIDVPEGTWTVRVSATDYRLTVLENVGIAGGAAPVSLEIRLSQGAVISGVVTGFPPTEPGGRELWFTGAEGNGGSAPVGADGRFRVTGLVPGAYVVTWAAPSVPDQGPVRAFAAPTRLVVTDRDASVDVGLAPAGALSVTTDDTALPIAGRSDEADAAARARVEKSAWVVRDSAGQVVLRRAHAMRGRLGGLDRVVLPPGRYRVELERPGVPVAAADVEIAAASHVVRTLGRP